MFKKISALTLVLLYLVTASGFAINLHYCGNKLASVKIDAPAKKCGLEKKINKMKCCRDKHIEVKVKDVHKVPPTSILSKLFSIDLPRLPFEDYIFPSEEETIDTPVQRGPPNGGSKTDRYTQNCSYRI